MLKLFSVWVGGVEVNSHLTSYDDALNIAELWIELGYDGVKIWNDELEEVLCSIAINIGLKQAILMVI